MIAFTIAAHKMLARQSQAERATLSVDRFEMRTVESSPSQPSSGNDSTRSSGTDDRNSGAPGDVPDVSAEFRSEFAALLAFYAARIAAARNSLSPGTAAAIVQALLGEQAVALRGIMDRWHGASQKQRDEKPDRPAGNAQRKDDDPKPS
jgi:hypothetical protein